MSSTVWVNEMQVQVDNGSQKQVTWKGIGKELQGWGEVMGLDES